jgi:hypothetical protein
MAIAAVLVTLGAAMVSALPEPRHAVFWQDVAVAPDVTLTVGVAGRAGAQPVVLLHGFPEGSLSWASLVDPLLDGSDLQLWMPNLRSVLLWERKEGADLALVPRFKGLQHELGAARHWRLQLLLAGG